MKAMKSIVLIFALLVSGHILGQNQQKTDDKWGSNPEQCKMNLSVYREFVKQKNYVDALPAWRKTIQLCPKSTKNLYIDGAKIYKFLIKQNKDNKELKSKYVDSLMWVYDMRIKYFGHEAENLGKKGVDLYSYDKSRYNEAYEYCKKSYEALGKNTLTPTMFTMFRIAVKKYKKKELDKTQVLDDFTAAMDVYEYTINNAPAKKDSLQKLADATTDPRQKNKLLRKIKRIDKEVKLAKDLRSKTELLFTKSGVADCQTLESIYQPKFESHKEDTVFLKQSLKILYKVGCTESDLFIKIAEAQYKIKPTETSAYSIAKLLSKKGEYSKAVNYYKKAIELANDSSEDKPKYYLELATILGTKLNNKAEARNYAYKALELKPKWGKPYLLIGSLYASSSKSCGKDKFEQQAVFWSAVDMFIKAKSVDPEVAGEANKLIGKYSQYFPDKEDAFFHGVKEGDTYQVGCWINVKTKARFK